jgi:hypothetical protein
VSDLSPLAGCSEMLEELWMAGNGQVQSLVPLKACTRLAKLDLCDCNAQLLSQLGDLKLACTQLADPSSVVLEGLVHDLQPGIPSDHQESAIDYLENYDHEFAGNRVAAAGGILPLVKLLDHSPGKMCRRQQQSHLRTWLHGHADNRTAITAAGAILREDGSMARVQGAAGWELDTSSSES